MSVGPFSDAAFRSCTQSNSDTRRSRFVVEVFSVVTSCCSETFDRSATISHEIGCDNEPEVPSGGSWTRIGYVRQTITTLRTRLGEMPASERHPSIVVSREVTKG